MELSKSDFATHINVSPARISQYLHDGTIGPDALVGEGRNARINVEVATEQLKARRHVGQSLGNGLMTRLEGGPKPSLAQSPAEPEAETDTAKLIQLERLEQERRRNRQADRDEAIANRLLVGADELEVQVRKAVRETVELFTGMAPDIANAISARYALPARDLQHVIVEVMAEKRAVAARQIRDAGESLPETKEAVVS